MLDLLTAAPREVRFGDRTFLVGALKLLELGRLQRWIRDNGTRPTVEVKEQLEFTPEAEQRSLRRDAYFRERDAWPPAIGTSEGNAVLFRDLEGQLYFLGVMLRKHQPELTDAEVEAVAAGLSEVDFGVLVAIAFGSDDLDPEAARAMVQARIKLLAAAIAPNPSDDAAAIEGSITGSSSPTSGATPTDERGPGKSAS